MFDKPLHEKKISELRPPGFYDEEWGCEWLGKLRAWAIACVNNCRKSGHIPQVIGLDIRGNLDEIKKLRECQVCKFLIEKFELTEEELRGNSEAEAKKALDKCEDCDASIDGATHMIE